MKDKKREDLTANVTVDEEYYKTMDTQVHLENEKTKTYLSNWMKLNFVFCFFNLSVIFQCYDDSDLFAHTGRNIVILISSKCFSLYFHQSLIFSPLINQEMSSGVAAGMLAAKKREEEEKQKELETQKKQEKSVNRLDDMVLGMLSSDDDSGSDVPKRKMEKNIFLYSAWAGKISALAW